VITKASLLAAGPKKMILRVSKILLEEIVFVIDNPGNDIERYQQYTFQKMGDPSKTLVIRSTGVSFSVKVTQDAQFLNHKNFMVYFINFFVQHYSSILCRANYVIHGYRYVMAFVNMLTHARSLAHFCLILFFTRQASRNMTC
jgi:hypothetical protein